MNYVEKMMRDEQRRKDKIRRQDFRRQMARVNKLLKQARAVLAKGGAQS